MSYYVIDSIGQLPVSTAGIYVKNYDPQSGCACQPPDALPLEGYFDPGYPGEWEKCPAPPRPFYPDTTLPLFRNDVLEAVLAAGVDNLKMYPCILKDKYRPDVQFTDYTAVHVVGLIYSACKSRSEMMELAEPGDVIPDNFSRLHINAAKADGVLMFHLGEATNALVVHEKVKKSILSRGIKHMHFYGPGEWAG